MSDSSSATGLSEAWLACTPGDPAGIGPDLVILLAAARMLDEIVVIASKDVIRRRATELGEKLDILEWPNRTHRAGQLTLIDVQCPVGVDPGSANPEYAEYVMESLNKAIDGCLSGQFDAMVTGPVNKGLINDAGIPFSGHTEYLAARTAAEQPVMMLATEGLRVALVTTHLPLRDVSKAITPPLVEQVLRIVHADLGKWMGLERPAIRVCGLNPHAGESGHMGREDLDIILPVIRRLAREGLNVSGPWPADTVFTDHHLRNADVVVAMYHDQGLPVLKYKGFGSAVNITLGLPIVRTSVDHGTAYDLAGSGQIDTGSFVASIDTALAMIAGVA